VSRSNGSAVTSKSYGLIARKACLWRVNVILSVYT
jgi:hypothetical protein